jgi:hypothetical protein
MQLDQLDITVSKRGKSGHWTWVISRKTDTYAVPVFLAESGAEEFATAAGAFAEAEFAVAAMLADGTAWTARGI